MKMYFFERLLYRISISKYKYNFILKGGLLLSAIFGDERRTTGDMDTMIKGIELDFEILKKVIEEIVISEEHVMKGKLRIKLFLFPVFQTGLIY
ncbi:MAG: nucleotidyl transferase AbiEii/AbiGii toxin family protein [Bacilli bacterium]